MKSIEYMQRALRLAKRGLGHVSPNPLVGAVLVKDDRIIGEGLHERFGDDHAEVNAIKYSVEDPKGATLYINLEPCCHTNKKTPPCADFIIKHKVAKVIVSNLDPNPEVSGKGLEKLRQNGIKVESGLLEEEGRRLNEIFFHHITTKTPFVHIKVAQTLDGKLCTEQGDSKWITGVKARKKGHNLRKEYDAVLIGRKTLNNDNPSLTCRFEKADFEQQPWRLVLGDPNLMNLDTYMFNDDYKSKTIVLSTAKEEEVASKVRKFLEPIRMIFLDKSDESQFWSDLLHKVTKLNIASVLVEGGPNTIRHLLKTKMWNKMSCFIGPNILGNGPGYYSSSVEKIENSLALSRVKMEKYETDFCIVGYRE